MQLIKTILADDQCIFIEGLKSVLTAQQRVRFDVAGVAYNGKDLIRLLKKQTADLLIFDLNLPEQDGLEVLRFLQTENIPIKVLVLSRYDDPKIVKSAFKSGVDGYILKDKGVEELFAAIYDILDGRRYVGEGVAMNDAKPKRMHENYRPFNGADGFIKKHNLTKRELEILRLITAAMSNKEIARELFISDQTVSVHRKNIMRKLGVSNTAALIRSAYENSLF